MTPATLVVEDTENHLTGLAPRAPRTQMKISYIHNNESNVTF